MKQLLPIFICLLNISILSGQVQESTIAMSKGSANAFSIVFNDYHKNNLASEWKKFIKTFDAKLKKDKKNKEFFAEDVAITKISDQPIDIYTKIITEDNITSLIVWFSLDDVFVSSKKQPNEAAAIQEILSQFSLTAILNEFERNSRLEAQNKSKGQIRRTTIKGNSRFPQKM